MNIFEIFVSGDGRVDEANMSSLLAFLLTPGASHGYGRAFLGEFLQFFQYEIEKMPFWPEITPRNRPKTMLEAVNAFTTVKVGLEERLPRPVSTNENNSFGARLRRELDITVRLYGPDSRLRLVVGIENKIRDSAASGEMQLSDEYQWLRHAVDEEVGGVQASGEKVPIIFIYLTPNTMDSSGPYVRKQWGQLDKFMNGASCRFDIHKNVSWHESHADHAPSISKLAHRMLELELWGRINPPSSHSSLILRSLIKFIDNDFSMASGTYGQDANGEMEVLTNDTFWNSWPPGKSDISKLAKKVEESANKALASGDLALRLRQAGLKPRSRFSKSRITLFLDKDNSPTDIMSKRVQNTILRIRQDGSTTAHRLHLEIERRAYISPDSLFETLDQSVKDVIEIGSDDHRTTYDLLLRVKSKDLELVNSPHLLDEVILRALSEGVESVLCTNSE